MKKSKTLQVKRVYEPASHDDGFRVLVDRLWPRGLSKTKAQIDLWAKNIAPSTELRRWYGHEVDKWPLFQTRYRTELDNEQGELIAFVDALPSGTITLLYGSKKALINHAIVLKEYLVTNFAMKTK